MPCELMMKIMGNHFATMATFVLVIDSLLLIKKKQKKKTWKVKKSVQK